MRLPTLETALAAEAGLDLTADALRLQLELLPLGLIVQGVLKKKEEEKISILFIPYGGRSDKGSYNWRTFA